LLEAGCPGTEIAPHFDLGYDRFYDRVQQQYGIGFTEYSQKIRQKGDSNIREKQYKKALKGDNTLLIWLGKNRLGQKENPDIMQFTQQDLEKFNAIMQQISQHQTQISALKIADSKIINADRS
jgi:hypothetical protein